MEIKVLRFSSQKNDTLGIVFINNIFQCYCLEDEFREVKIKGETRIPKGIYKLGIQEQITPLTEKYRSKYEWFKNHLHVKDVKNFNSIYIHIGNSEKNTDGCLLLGNKINNNRKEIALLSDSTTAFKEFYELVYDSAKNGLSTIEYIDYA